MKSQILAILLAAACIQAAPILTTPPAPFTEIATDTSGEVIAPKFNADEMIFDFGSKKVEVRKNGTFRILSDTRIVANVNWIFRTSYQPNSVGNAGLKEPVKYNGGGMCVTDCIADSAAQSITVRGILPYHAKNTSPAITGTWTQTLKLLPDGKLDYVLETSDPEGHHPADRGIFISLPNADGYVLESTGELLFSGKQPNTNPGKYMVTKSFNPLDDIRIDIVSPNMIYSHMSQQKVFRINQHPSVKETRVHLIFDLMKRTVEAPRSTGGVDLKKVDDLDMSSTGTNMLPNPYFAQGLMYINSNAGSPGDFVLKDNGGKFGKYYVEISENRHWFYPAAVPADKGTYTFSFYSKGKGHVNVITKSHANRWDLSPKAIIIDAADWTRYSYTFQTESDGVISLWLGFSNIAAGNSIYLDGLQLERGGAATDFAAPVITARMITNPPDGFLESGKPMSAKLELSTLTDAIKGKAEVTIRNFFREEILSHQFSFDFGKDTNPAFELPIAGKLQDGIHTVEVKYHTGSESREYFRLGVMPWLENRHAIHKLFAKKYNGEVYKAVWCNPSVEKELARDMAIGVGSIGDAPHHTPELDALYKKYRMTITSSSVVLRRTAESMKQIFPETDPKPGHIYFYIHDPDGGLYSNIKGLLPDYRLCGGWTPEYREKFVTIVKKLISRFPEREYYSFATEWPAEIKRDPNYPDIFLAYAETVRSVYPNAKIYERGDTNMEPREGTAAVGHFLSQIKGRWQPDLAGTHVYTRPLTNLYPNFREFVKTVDNSGFPGLPLVFPEGGHFYPYAIPQWNIPLIAWWSGHGAVWGAGTLSYDLGWSERLSAAYYARFYLVFLTEFQRVLSANSSAGNTGNYALDINLVPRAFQKIPNTLGTLLGNPKRYIGDFTFAPETKCFIWEDEQGRPLAAVWNENSAVDTGMRKSPSAKYNYQGAEYIDLMGVARTPAEDGVFPVSPFPLFIRGKAGDSEAFVRAISHAVIGEATALPFRIADRFSSLDTIELTFTNDLARTISGKIKIQGREYDLNIPGNAAQSLSFKLDTPAKPDRITKLNIPYECVVDGQTFRSSFKTDVLSAVKFTGSWDKVPSIEMTNRIDSGNGKDDFSASFQTAWDKSGLYLRVTVIDDMLTASEGAMNRWNWDVLQVYFDARCSARKNGTKHYDDDDYDYSIMPVKRTGKAEVWRAVSADPQLGLGTAAPANNTFAHEIPCKFTIAPNGYIYEVFFPVNYLLPARMEQNYNLGFGLYAADRDEGSKAKQGLSLASEPGQGCYNRPDLWPILILE